MELTMLHLVFCKGLRQAPQTIAYYSENLKLVFTQPLDTLQVVGNALSLVEEFAPQQSLSISVDHEQHSEISPPICGVHQDYHLLVF